ncbi:hypothetical protein [Desulforamulus ruminis]|uniref:Uncharacterized protein n=1 Tax=Desulforamulus ruminis (strain ATCC 23193 / DSM 2154 / NCIMB 8452 / DL) TaxID=696281 RepID=F6DRX6_DESRL|nr:hypothetical protein [Desulforamulus ruminis]AEG61000.1 hypothetical protein Desru_2785 [Desulforamulus ruminis DSM 2154]
MKKITLEEMQEVFEERINGRCVTVTHETENGISPATFNNIELVLYKNGEIHFCEQDEEAHYSKIFKSSNIEEIDFLDYTNMPGQTGGQILIHYKNGDKLDITADF